MQEENIIFPTLVCPKYHTSIMVVSEDDKDIMNSKLLSSKSLCVDQKNMLPGSLKVVEDILREVTQPSPIVNTVDPRTQEIINRIPEIQRDIEGIQQQQQQKEHQRQQELQRTLQEQCAGFTAILGQTAHLEHKRAEIQRSALRLQHSAQHDAQDASNIPKPDEILQRIEQLKASEELPEYLFGLLKRQRAWQAHAPQHLLEWKTKKEQFYCQQFEDCLRQSHSSETREAAQRFLQLQLEQITQQIKQITQDEDDDHHEHLLDLSLETPESLGLVTNGLLTPETRLVYQIKHDVTNQDGVSIAHTFERLDQLLNLEIQLNTSGKSTSGLQHLARGMFILEISKAIVQMKQLRTLRLTSKGGSITNEQAKQFFVEISKSSEKLTSLVEVTFDFSQTTLQKETAHSIVSALQRLGNNSVRTVNLHFNVGGVNLNQDFGVALGEALKHFPGLRTLYIDLGGFSLKYNEIRDKGFSSLVQSFEHFSQTLSKLTLNVSHNQITDQGIIDFHQVVRATKWPRLKEVSLVLQHNSITEKGVRRLAKIIGAFPILLKLQLNLGSNQIDLNSVKQLVKQLPPYLLTNRINVRGCGLPETELKEFVDGHGLQSKLLY